MYYSTIKPVDIANGPGVRVSLFVSGCPHRCKGCFNSETWSYKNGLPFTDITFRDVINLMKPTWIRGLSLLGGEPLDPNNIKCVTELVKEAKARYPEKDIWCYTGYKWEDVCELPILQYIDVLVDGKYIENERDITLRFRGSRNQRLINVSQSIKTKTIVLWDI
jgi:anaerobic ribonucleoside-triphosphate reductase activating protein